MAATFAQVLELPMLHPERFVQLGIDPPKGVLLYGPPGTGKTLAARAVANRTDACFIRVIGSELGACACDPETGRLHGAPRHSRPQAARPPWPAQQEAHRFPAPLLA